VPAVHGGHIHDEHDRSTDCCYLQWGAWETMLNGHPDEKMPALRELDLGYVIDALTYLQELPDRR
jgi:hypothetical protein